MTISVCAIVDRGSWFVYTAEKVGTSVNIEFHYYIIHYLANQAGFSEEDARTLAYSSQFVDHNIVSYLIQTDTETYRTFPTQNYGFWDDSFPLEVYIPFHFFPGNTDHKGALREDGHRSPLNCTPNSENVKKLLVTALKTRNLYRIGIALHTYADSWAHQNFTGLLEEWNRIEKRSLIPAIGHAQTLRKPDDPGGVWTDTRLSHNRQEVVNRERVIAAGRMIYKYLCTYNRRSYDDMDLIVWKLDELVGASGEKTREERIADIVIEENMSRYHRSEWLHDAFHVTEDPGNRQIFSGYDKLLWLKDAVLYRSSLAEQKPVKAKTGFYESDFYKWQESARANLSAAKSILKGVVY